MNVDRPGSLAMQIRRIRGSAGLGSVVGTVAVTGNTYWRPCAPKILGSTFESGPNGSERTSSRRRSRRQKISVARDPLMDPKRSQESTVT
jgi:hypothetical protein